MGGCTALATLLLLSEILLGIGLSEHPSHAASQLHTSSCELEVMRSELALLASPGGVGLLEPPKIAMDERWILAHLGLTPAPTLYAVGYTRGAQIRIDAHFLWGTHQPSLESIDLSMVPLQPATPLLFLPAPQKVGMSSRHSSYNEGQVAISLKYLSEQHDHFDTDSWVEMTSRQLSAQQDEPTHDGRIEMSLKRSSHSDASVKSTHPQELDATMQPQVSTVNPALSDPGTGPKEVTIPHGSFVTILKYLIFLLFIGSGWKVRSRVITSEFLTFHSDCLVSSSYYLSMCR